MLKLDLEKAEEPEIKLPTSTGSSKRQESSRKSSTSALLTKPKHTDCVDHNKLWKILQGMGTLDHFTSLLRNLCAGQEATVRTGHGTDWFQIRKGVHQGCILSPCLFNLYADYVMWNAGLDEAQAGIKITGRNISDLRYTDGTSFMAENVELKSLLMKVKEKSGKVGSKLNIQKIKIMASDSITSWQRWGNNGNGDTFFFYLQNHCK